MNTSRLSYSPLKYSRILAFPVVLLCCSGAFAQPSGEAAEPTPEELDAAFTAEDAAREAAAFSDEILDRGPADPLAALTAAADLVVRGRVVSQSVQYNSDDIPFTHTTIAIDEVLAGESPGAELAIVQEGGPSRTDPELVYMVSETHYFSSGGEEVLFLGVEAGGSPGDRRIEVQERFRVHAGRVYTETGRGVILDSAAGGPGNSLRLSADRNPDPSFREIQIGPHTFTRQFGGGGSQGDDDSGTTAQRSGAPAAVSARSYRDSADVESFSAAISQ